MSLTQQDLKDIREVILEALDIAVNPRLDTLENQMDSMDSRMSNMEGKMTEQESNQHTTNRRLGVIDEKLDDILGRLEAFEADIKELYKLLDTGVPFDKKFAKLPPEQKVRKLHAAVLKLADQLHIEL